MIIIGKLKVKVRSMVVSLPLTRLPCAKARHSREVMPIWQGVDLSPISSILQPRQSRRRQTTDKSSHSYFQLSNNWRNMPSHIKPNLETACPARPGQSSSLTLLLVVGPPPDYHTACDDGRAERTPGGRPRPHLLKSLVCHPDWIT